jgi:hypothetical protein
MFLLMGVLLMAGGAVCVVVGYLLGSWRERLLVRRELQVDELESRERFMDLLESLMDRDPEEAPRGDDRPN